MSAAPDCRHARLHIGAAPQHLPSEVTLHIATCADCSRFHGETLALDGRVRSALEVPLSRFRERAPPARRFALAASVVLALLMAGGFWLLNPQPALAGEVAEHVLHEAGSWDMREPLSADAVGEVLRQAGVDFDSTMPVVYAMACPFRGQRVSHLVVQTSAGPLTVMLLPHEKVAGRTEFSEHGYRGVLLPAGQGAVAVLSREGAVPESVAAEIASSVR
jgi:Protein of unknown function (DUF3379)